MEPLIPVGLKEIVRHLALTGGCYYHGCGQQHDGWPERKPRTAYKESKQ